MVTKPKACHDVTVCNESRSVQRRIFDGKIDVRESHDPYDKTVSIVTLFRLLQTSPFSFVARKGNRRRLLAGRRDCIPSHILYTLTNGIFACEWDFYAFSWLSLFVNCCVTYFVTHPGICQGVIGYSISSFMGVRDIGSCQPLLCHSFWLLAGRRSGFFIPPNPLPLCLLGFDMDRIVFLAYFLGPAPLLGHEKVICCK